MKNNVTPNMIDFGASDTPTHVTDRLPPPCEAGEAASGEEGHKAIVPKSLKWKSPFGCSLKYITCMIRI